jgi:hypothetical protein
LSPNISVEGSGLAEVCNDQAPTVPAGHGRVSAWVRRVGGGGDQIVAANGAARGERWRADGVFRRYALFPCTVVSCTELFTRGSAFHFVSLRVLARGVSSSPCLCNSHLRCHRSTLFFRWWVGTKRPTSVQWLLAMKVRPNDPIGSTPLFFLRLHGLRRWCDGYARGARGARPRW